MSRSIYRKKFWIIAVLAVFVFIIAGGGIAAFLIRYSATSERMCQQCHPEITELWKKSNGHPPDKTSCFECHSYGLQITPKDWNIFKHARDQLAPPQYLADDALTSQRCIECHQDILSPVYQVKKMIIKLNHRYHNQEGLMCIDCHRAAGHEYFTNNTNRPSITECLECHIKEFEGPPKNKRCLNCHEVMLAPGKSLEKKRVK